MLNVSGDVAEVGLTEGETQELLGGRAIPSKEPDPVTHPPCPSGLEGGN